MVLGALLAPLLLAVAGFLHALALCLSVFARLLLSVGTFAKYLAFLGTSVDLILFSVVFALLICQQHESSGISLTWRKGSDDCDD